MQFLVVEDIFMASHQTRFMTDFHICFAFLCVYPSWCPSLQYSRGHVALVWMWMSDVRSWAFLLCPPKGLLWGPLRPEASFLRQALSTWRTGTLLCLAPAQGSLTGNPAVTRSGARSRTCHLVRRGSYLSRRSTQCVKLVSKHTIIQPILTLLLTPQLPFAKQIRG